VAPAISSSISSSAAFFVRCTAVSVAREQGLRVQGVEVRVQGLGSRVYD
jgi:hypothetical protein